MYSWICMCTVVINITSYLFLSRVDCLFYRAGNARYRLHPEIKISDSELQFVSLKWAKCKSVFCLMCTKFEEVMTTIKALYIYLYYKISLLFSIIVDNYN